MPSIYQLPRIANHHGTIGKVTSLSLGQTERKLKGL